MCSTDAKKYSSAVQKYGVDNTAVGARILPNNSPEAVGTCFAGQISGAGDSTETMDALKEGLILMDARVGTKADIDEVNSALSLAI